MPSDRISVTLLGITDHTCFVILMVDGDMETECGQPASVELDAELAENGIPRMLMCAECYEKHRRYHPSYKLPSLDELRGIEQEMKLMQDREDV